MPIIRRLSETGATPESIQRLENEIGHSLPDDYHRFLADFNGGEPEPSGFTFATNEGQSDSAVRYFLTLDKNVRNYSIWDFLRRYRDRLPTGVIPIACDSFGNLVLIDVGVKATGNVYFWDHEKQSMTDPTWDNISIVANSFTAFERSLQG
jgi:cell wall assembly regulator SMI1